MRRPDQAYGDYYRGKSASCALGAAYEGMYRLPTQAGGLRPTKDLEWFFDCLEGSVRKCPGGDGCKKTLSLAAILVHLNDDHRWSREQIAAAGSRRARQMRTHCAKRIGHGLAHSLHTSRHRGRRAAVDF